MYIPLVKLEPSILTSVDSGLKEITCLPKISNTLTALISVLFVF